MAQHVDGDHAGHVHVDTDGPTPFFGRGGLRAAQRSQFIPGFLVLVVVYVVGYLFIPNARAPLLVLGPYKLSWAEIILFAGAIIALLEQLRISHPGVDNTFLCIAMLVVAIVQLVLIVASGTDWFKSITRGTQMFLTTEFAMQTIVNFVQVAVAFIINTRTASRSIVNN